MYMEIYDGYLVSFSSKIVDKILRICYNTLFNEKRSLRKNRYNRYTSLQQFGGVPTVSSLRMGSPIKGRISLVPKPSQTVGEKFSRKEDGMPKPNGGFIYHVVMGVVYTRLEDALAAKER